MRRSGKRTGIAVRVAMTIAGSDSCGGAGIQADLKTFAALGVHGTSAVTAITAQNTTGVYGVQEIGPKLITEQIRAVVEDMGVNAAKTGMLSSSRIISEVAKTVKRYGFPLVIDPVMVSKSGARLLEDDAVNALKSELLPLASVVTPNAREAERLSGIRIRSRDDARRAARKISEKYGAESCIVKGGHLPGSQSVDVLYYRGRLLEFPANRIETKTTHGTGCSFSAAIAAELAKGSRLLDAVRLAKLFVTSSIMYGLPLGKGNGPVNPTSWLIIPAERWNVIENLDSAIRILKTSRGIQKLVPEVQMNIAMALPSLYLRSKDDVAAIPGRIARVGEGVRAVLPPRFGASSHVASAIMKAMEYDPRIRAAANIRFSREILGAAREQGFTTALHDRGKEPREVKEKEGASVPWGVEQAIRRHGKVPDLIYDVGDVGKEPLVRVFGADAVEVAKKIRRIANRVKANGKR